MKLAVAIGFALAFGNAYAFHEGGVAYCDGCHTMHASEGGVTMRRSTVSQITQYQAGPYLLQGRDQSGACLNCHESTKAGSYYVSTSGIQKGWSGTGFAAPTTIPKQYSPGGDFSWLKLSYTWVSPRVGSEFGSRHGHNIIAVDFGYDAQPIAEYGNGAAAVGPGGQYPFGVLHCSSCHDPHGKTRLTTTGWNNGTTTSKPIFASGSYGEEPNADYAIGAYRLLGGNSYRPMSVTQASLAFTTNPPVAVAPGTYNRSEALTQNRVAYGSGMSEWCANCHANIHANVAVPGAGSMRHPTGSAAQLDGTTADGRPFDFAANYKAYVKTGDLGGTDDGSFLSLVQFEEGTSAIASLLSHASITNGYMFGPPATANVSCLSCHRAHATAFQSMTRWENKSEFLTIDHGGGPVWPDQYADANEGVEARGKNNAMMTAAYYGRPASTFAGFQRSLCNKCHVKD